MILQRLYDLAVNTGELADPAFVRTRVACALKVGRNGEYRGLVDFRERVETPGKGKRPPRVEFRGGLELPVPIRAVMWDLRMCRWKTNDAAASGQERPAVFCTDTLARLLPMDGLLKTEKVEGCRRQRDTFWRFIEFVAGELPDDALAACAKLAAHMRQPTAEFAAAVESELKAKNLDKELGLCTLAWVPDEGTVLEREAIQGWWRQFYNADRAGQSEGRATAWCQLTHEPVALPEKIEFPIEGLKRINCRAKAYLVVGLSSASSYGFKLAESCRVSARGIEGFTRAIQMLNENRLPSRADPSRAGGIQSSFEIGRRTLLLFWTRDRESTGLELLQPSELANPDDFAAMLDSLEWRAAQAAKLPDDQQDQFRVLAITGNSDGESARVFVRDYLEGPLPRLLTNILNWFADLRIADLSNEYQGRPNAAFPLWLLATTTALAAERVAPDTHTRLMHAALTGGPVPDSVLAACLGRLRVMGNDGFRAARMGLIKLCLNRTHCKDQPMHETLDKTRIKDIPYNCGRLLAFMARCQSPKDFGSSARIVERFFAAAVMSPRSVFPTLIKHNRNHISIIRGQNKGFAFNLDKELDELMDLLTPAGGEVPDFPTTLSLAAQGRFAIGFYQQRAEYRRASAADQPPSDLDVESESETD